MKAQLKKGHIDIYLQGQKLKGRFNLVKLPKADENAWLLIKYKDQFASTEEILKQDLSARTGLSMADINLKAIATQKDNATPKINFSKLSNSPKTAMPTLVKPMMATLVKQSFDHPNWIFEIKWDGYRIIAYLNNKNVTLLSRNQQNYTKIFSEVSESLAQLKLQAVLDGEMVILDEEGKAHFQLLQQFQKQVRGIYFIIFLICCG